MNIVMNEALRGRSKFTRVFMVSLPREIADEEGNTSPMNWMLAMKNLTQVVLEDPNRSLTPGAFMKEDDEGFLPCIFQTQCTKFAAIGNSASFMLEVPEYNDESLGETPVIKEISDNLLKDGIYLPFFMFIEKNDYISVLEANEKASDMYVIMVSEITSEARGENLTDFFVATTNLSELIKQHGFTKDSFTEATGEDTMRVLYPMLMSAVSSDISSPYPPEIFQVSTYFQNVETEEVKEETEETVVEENQIEE